MNRVLPPDVTDPYFGKWKDIQAEHLATVHESFEPVPILSARLFDREMVGIPLLEEMGDEVYGDLDAADVLYRDDPIRVRRRGSDYVLVMRLPFASRRDGHPPTGRGAVRQGRLVQTEPDPAADTEAHDRPRGELRGITWRSCSGEPRPAEGAEMAEAAKGGSPRGAAAPEDGADEDRAHVCTVGFCPIRLTVTAVQPLRPEAVEHLLNAGREFLLAMTAIRRAGGRDRREGDGAEAHAHRHRVSAPRRSASTSGEDAALRVAADGDVVARATRRTPADDEAATLAALDDAVEEVRVDAVVAIGGRRGSGRRRPRTLLSSPNLSWRDVPSASALRATFASP